MKIAITQRYKEGLYGSYDYYISEDNVKTFEDKGIFLMPVSNTIEMDYVVKECDALFVPGGADVDPYFYNEEINGSKNVNRKLDEVDIAYIEAFNKAGKPILGICRGQQIINVCFGGTLYQDIAEHVNVWHDVLVDKDSFIYDLYKEEKLRVNSFHHQAVKDVAPGFKVAARATDGTIEAISKDNIYCVQWHPEMYDGARFISYFLEKIFK